MYHLLLEKIKTHQRMALLPQSLPVASQPQRKASITTGVGKNIEHTNNCLLNKKMNYICRVILWKRGERVVTFKITLPLNTFLQNVML